MAIEHGPVWATNEAEEIAARYTTERMRLCGLLRLDDTVAELKVVATVEATVFAADGSVKVVRDSQGVYGAVQDTDLITVPRLASVEAEGLHIRNSAIRGD